MTYNGAYTAGPVAAVVPGRFAGHEKRNDHICARYRPQQVTLTVTDSGKHHTRDVQAIILQHGQLEQDVTYNPDILTAQRPPTQYVTLSVRLVKHKISNSVWDNIQKQTNGFKDSV